MRQNQNVRVIASDLDGTLLTPDKQVTSFTREILAKAVSRGVHFVPCTGRPFDAVPQSVRDQLAQVPWVFGVIYYEKEDD